MSAFEQVEETDAPARTSKAPPHVPLIYTEAVLMPVRNMLQLLGVQEYKISYHQF